MRDLDHIPGCQEAVKGKHKHNEQFFYCNHTPRIGAKFTPCMFNVQRDECPLNRTVSDCMNYWQFEKVTLEDWEDDE